MTLTCGWTKCNESFDSVSELVQHISNVHLDSSNNANICFWSDCDRHGQAFHSRSSLNAHIRRHTGEKPFICNFCQKTFSRSDALSKHVKSHSEDTSPNATDILSPNDCFNPVDYILKHVVMENLSLKRKLYSIDLKKKRIRAYNFLVLEYLRRKSKVSKSNPTDPL